MTQAMTSAFVQRKKKWGKSTGIGASSQGQNDWQFMKSSTSISKVVSNQ